MSIKILITFSDMSGRSYLEKVRLCVCMTIDRCVCSFEPEQAATRTLVFVRMYSGVFLSQEKILSNYGSSVQVM